MQHHPSPFDPIPELYSMPEHASRRLSRPMARSSTAPNLASPAYPMYPGLQTPGMNRYRTRDSVPIVLNRPRRLSGHPSSNPNANPNTNANLMSAARPDESFDPRARVPSSGLVTSRRSVEQSSWRPTYPQPPRPAGMQGHGAGTLPADVFATLPGEVLEVILQMLKELHLDADAASCATCWMRDLCSLSLCSRKWYGTTRRALYADILIVGQDSPAHKKRFKQSQGSRIMLLRSTLRANRGLASLVRSLKVPIPVSDLVGNPVGAKGATASGSQLEEYEDNVAALVMACPKLERLSGPIFTYGHSFKKIFHALSTRTNLRDMNWLIEPSASSAASPVSQSAERSSPCAAPAEAAKLQPAQEVAFLEQHRNWKRLTTLSIHCLPEATIGQATLLSRTLTVLPCLQNLHLSNLSPDAFNNKNLLSLPALHSLTLSNIPGISSQGLSQFATRANSRSLQSLTLRHTPLTSLPALARILSNLISLTSFALVQSFPPLMPESDSFVLWMMPYLASTTVTKLHWDITSHTQTADLSSDILARSIQAGGFPRLRTLRAPNDPEGSFQSLCRPVERIDLPADRLRSTSSSSWSLDALNTSSSPPAQLVRSPTTVSLPGAAFHAPPSPCTNLVAARLAAQARIESARDGDGFRFHVYVEDEDGSLVNTFGLGRYMGAVGSEIEYHLLPDEGSSDERGGLVDVTDLAGDAGESLTSGREGCDGSWNRREGVFADRREREKWWHAERGRWNKPRLN
ncbi:hypothetical protein DCS_05632 [Drechmeria coniospora]|uniref:F-box domain-containing protein n=1 Tax=Drechmeria coniospora TaxID=98403 RepID=A0A151GNC7_DRECN|nr:hypothetical protein DCS_05632 [Drechmeria coniospora]KYK58615.1 hypothetical protein DCS_05632 [Drechmeria coniospora]ODA83980.1 hypothetical protein RJ55_02498 [Drechmeria coniospora]